jgi:hypothetical protein
LEVDLVLELVGELEREWVVVLEVDWVVVLGVEKEEELLSAAKLGQAWAADLAVE